MSFGKYTYGAPAIHWGNENAKLVVGKFCHILKINWNSETIFIKLLFYFLKRIQTFNDNTLDFIENFYTFYVLHILCFTHFVFYTFCVLHILCFTHFVIKSVLQILKINWNSETIFYKILFPSWNETINDNTLFRFWWNFITFL